ncbi:hypothetical protein PA25_12490 [Pseudoalteromonas sp. A25]|nr:hypothetical protein PA25_12490 [Pseudoalteromonas sp. A25]
MLARLYRASNVSYQSAITFNPFEGLNLTTAALKISHLEQLNNEIFALLSTRFSCFKIDHLVKRIGITLILRRE